MQQSALDPTSPAAERSASYSAPPQLQQRTSRSFVGASPPDPLAVWVLAQGFRPIPKSASEHEYGRFRKADELVILYWSGLIVASGEAWEQAARRLADICEQAPEQACLFDPLDAATPPRVAPKRPQVADLPWEEEYARPPRRVAKGGAL
jgi:hypothetical protein